MDDLISWVKVCGAAFRSAVTWWRCMRPLAALPSEWEVGSAHLTSAETWRSRDRELLVLIGLRLLEKYLCIFSLPLLIGFIQSWTTDPQVLVWNLAGEPLGLEERDVRSWISNYCETWSLRWSIVNTTTLITLYMMRDYYPAQDKSANNISSLLEQDLDSGRLIQRAVAPACWYAERSATATFTVQPAITAIWGAKTYMVVIRIAVTEQILQIFTVIYCRNDLESPFSLSKSTF